MADDPADRDDGPDRAGVLFVGRLVEKKGVADLLEALSRLPEPLRSVRTTIVGYGPLLKPLRAQADRLGLSVDFLGQQPSREVQRLMAEHLVFCAPSQTARDGDAEGLPMVIVEAARSAMAVVTYAHAGIPEAVHHGRTGLVVPERDVAGLSAALAEVLTDPERARALGRAGRETAGVQFRLDRQTEQLERIYDLVSGGS
jgi:glycosyltransferase involved in cell wall biosynthesis